MALAEVFTNTQISEKISQESNKKELLESYNLPATFINKFQVVMNGPYVRIGFSEIIYDDLTISLPRTALVMDRTAARDLIKVLTNLLANTEPK